MNGVTKRLIGSKRYADYMHQFHKRDDGTETNKHMIAEMLWYAQLASNGTMPIKMIGYDEECDDLSVLIDNVQYSISVKNEEEGL
jgi:hypothetical protein